MYYPNTKWTLCFFLCVAVQSAIDIVLESVVLAQYASKIYAINCVTVTVPVYLAIFVFAHLFQLVLAYDALRLQNTIQIIGLCIFNLAIFFYAILQINQIANVLDETNITEFTCVKTNFGGGSGDGVSYYAYSKDFFTHSLKPMLVVIPIVCAVAQVIYIYLAWKLYQEFGWKIYKRIGADVRMKKMYMYYQIFICFIKYDFFFFIGFTIQFIVIVLANQDIEFILTIVVMPLTLLLLVMAVIGVRYESKLLLSLFGFGCILGLAYFLFKTIRMYQPSQAYKYLATRKTLTVFSVLSLLMLMATIGMTTVCYLNFDQGLKAHLKSGSDEDSSKHSNGDMKEHRLTLD